MGDEMMNHHLLNSALLIVCFGFLGVFVTVAYELFKKCDKCGSRLTYTLTRISPFNGGSVSGHRYSWYKNQMCLKCEHIGQTSGDR